MNPNTCRILLVSSILAGLVLLHRMQPAKTGSLSSLLTREEQPPVTVVSAYYEFPSKHSIEEYVQWTSNFVRLSCHRVLFCDTHCERFRASAGPRLVIVPWALDQTDMAVLEPMWKGQAELDPERHLHKSHWLYAVWAQKAWFVKRAQELNPFKSMLFMWMDAGAFRESTRLPLLANWPRVEKAIELTRGDRIVALAIQPIPLASSPFLVGDYLGGTSFLATEKGWDRFRDLYLQTLALALYERKFVGKDQTIFNNMYLKRPEWFNLIDARQSTYDPWFFMQDLLA